MTIFITAAFVFLVIRFSVTLFNFISNPKLPRSARYFNDLVSILIPARNEAGNIILLLESIQKQDYSHYEVIVLDDGSTDETYKLCADFCAINPKFKIVKGKALKAGWLGKNYACHQLSKIAKGKYFLFIDADETISSHLISSLINRTEQEQLALLSLFTNQVMHSLGEKITVPLMHFILLNLLPLRLVKLSGNPAFSAASGQCMFFNADVYRKELWHKQVRAKVVEDIEIMRLVKLAGYKAEALLASGLIYCRMYKNLTEALNGFSKNLLAGFDNNIFVLLIYLLLVIAGPVAVFFNYNINLFAAYLSLVIISRLMISFLSEQNVLVNVFLHPVQMIFFTVISILSIIRHLFKKGTWKGRLIKEI